MPLAFVLLLAILLIWKKKLFTNDGESSEKALRKEKKMRCLVFALIFVLNGTFHASTRFATASPSPFYTQTVYVQKNTPTLTPDGSSENPFTSVHDAMASITDASPSKRYLINIASGSYTESLLHIKANVFLVGQSKFTVRLNIPWDLDDISWHNPSASTDDRSGFQDVSLVGSSNTANFSTQASGAGKIYFQDVRVNNLFTCVAYGPITQLSLDDTLFFGDVHITGVNTLLDGAYFVNGGNLIFSSTPVSLTLLSGNGGTSDGNVQFLFTPGDQNIEAILANFALTGSLTLDGAGTTVYTNHDVLPSPGDISITNNASLVFYN